ncbi:MAG: type II secretion system protein GspK [Polyangiaceae bacterium]
MRLHERLRQLRARSSRRGVALIMVIGSLTILAVMLSEFQDEMSVEFGSALSDRDALRAEYAARSAINLSRLLIASEPTVSQAAGFLLAALGQGKDKIQIPVWAFSGQILGAFNDAEGAARFGSLGSFDLSQGSNLGLDGAGFEVKIVDEDSKIGLNRAARSIIGAQDVARQLLGLMTGPQYDPLFERRAEDGEYANRYDICSAIIDWVDPDQDLENCEGTSNAAASPPEDSFYSTLKNPYPRKNAPFDSLEELRMVRGVGDDFWSTFIEPNPDDPDQRPVTIWGSGKLNINTVAAPTLLAYICAWAVPETPLCNDPTGEKQLNFITTLTISKAMFAGIPLFRSPRQLSNALQGKGQLAEMALPLLGGEPIQLLSAKGFEEGLATRSQVFSIYADGYLKSGKRATHVRVTAVVDFRDAPTVQDLINQVTGQTGQAQAGATTPGATPNESGDAVTNPNAIGGALKPSTAGRILYYRVN